MAGGPTGLPMLDGSSLNSNFGFALTIAVLPEFSRAPASIHSLSSSISASGIFGDFGGIFGSAVCITTPKSVLALESPASITFPEPPPAIAVVYVSRFNPPFCLSALWQELQRFLKICAETSSNVTFGFGASAAWASRRTPMEETPMARHKIRAKRNLGLISRNLERSVG